MAKQVLMIHEIKEWMLNPKLENYILTFDDGLYSQYYHLDFFKKINTEKIFFISTNIICPESTIQSTNFPPCAVAHELFFKNKDLSNYMKWSQIKEINNSDKCFIGGHSHHHGKNLNLNIKDQFHTLTSDSELMINEFKNHEINIEHFCFPYNLEHTLYREILKKYNIKYFYGKERISIEQLEKEFRDE